MAWLPDAPTVAAATFKVLDGPGAGGAPFELQFNPASLEYTVSNEFDDRNGNNGARQFVKKSSGKLSMTLVFDTTETGVSVRDVTAHISGLLEPAKDGSKQFAPKVEFGWGSYRFRGVVEQFKETLDFFSAEGVPLRSSIALTLASQEVEFQSNKSPSPAVDRSLPADPVSAAPGMGAASVASALGDPRAARAIAGANASASLRFGAEAGLAVGGSVTLSAAADFSAGAGVSLGAGSGVGLSVGAGAGLSVGAALTATAGPAFAGLSIAPPGVSVELGAARASLLPAPPVAGAAFGPGGRAVVQAGGSLSAEVGVQADLHGRIQFG
jgi:hypothetical protein